MEDNVLHPHPAALSLQAIQSLRFQVNCFNISNPFLFFLSVVACFDRGVSFFLRICLSYSTVKLIISLLRTLKSHELNSILILEQLQTPFPLNCFINCPRLNYELWRRGSGERLRIFLGSFSIKAPFKLFCITIRLHQEH